MNTQQAQLTTFSFPSKSSNSNKVTATLTRYLYYWPLFLLVTLILVILALAYISGLKPVYEAKATLLIQDQKKTPDQQTALQELNLAKSPKILENELEILKSRELIWSVVNDLKLYISYTSDLNGNKTNLYKNTPVTLTTANRPEISEPVSLQIEIKDGRSFFLVSSDGSKTEHLYTASLADSFGPWKLTPSANLKNYQGALITINIENPEQAALIYQNSINATLQNKLATAVTLSIQDHNPQRGKDIINRLIFNYNRNAKNQKAQETQSTIDFIDQRLSSLTGELTDAEKGIEGFKSSRGITDLSEDSKINLESMQVNDIRLNEVNVQLSVIEGIERYINANQNNGKVPSTLGISDPGLNSLIEQLSQLQLQRYKLLATMPETNPDFDPINNGIQSTRAAIKDNVRNIKSSLLSTKQQLQTFNSGIESNIKNIPTQERQYISIKRQQASKENLYTYLLQKKEEVSVGYATTISNEHIIDHAYAVPARGLKKMLALGSALLLGLLLPSGFIYLRNSVKNSIVNLDEIAEVIKTPVIGQLELSDEKRPIIIDDKIPSAMSEQIRALRTNLYHLYGNKTNGRVTLVTSSVSGEGKSFVSSNLAVALALSGRKTLLIESDLRKPKITTVFGLSKDKPGLSDLLMDRTSLNKAIQTYASNPNLDIISSGSLLNSPSELLEKEATKTLIEELRENYDDIIIDSPPVHLVPDALSLSKLSDVTLYIIRQGFTDKAELTFIKDLIDKEQLTNMACIFNGISKVKYGFGYDYDYSYYDQTNKKKPLSFLFRNFSNRFVMD